MSTIKEYMFSFQIIDVLFIFNFRKAGNMVKIYFDVYNTRKKSKQS